MMDELSADSSHKSIEARAAIQVDRVDPPRFPRQEHPRSAAHGFPLANSFTGVLNDPLARWDRFLCKHAKPFRCETGESEA
jgi:hypothetical protein